jgi:hypothetical protein
LSSLFSCYFLSLKSKFSPQCLVLTHPFLVVTDQISRPRSDKGATLLIAVSSITIML